MFASFILWHSYSANIKGQVWANRGTSEKAHSDNREKFPEPDLPLPREGWDEGLRREVQSRTWRLSHTRLKRRFFLILRAMGRHWRFIKEWSQCAWFAIIERSLMGEMKAGAGGSLMGVAHVLGNSRAEDKAGVPGRVAAGSSQVHTVPTWEQPVKCSADRGVWGSSVAFRKRLSVRGGQ